MKIPSRQRLRRRFSALRTLGWGETLQSFFCFASKKNTPTSSDDDGEGKYQKSHIISPRFLYKSEELLMKYRQSPPVAASTIRRAMWENVLVRRWHSRTKKHFGWNVTSSQRREKFVLLMSFVNVSLLHGSLVNLLFFVPRELDTMCTSSSLCLETSSVAPHLVAHSELRRATNERLALPLLVRLLSRLETFLFIFSTYYDFTWMSDTISNLPQSCTNDDMYQLDV